MARPRERARWPPADAGRLTGAEATLDADAGRGRPDRSSSPDPLEPVRPAQVGLCSRSVSSSADSTVWRGSRVEYGSWKTIWISRARAPTVDGARSWCGSVASVDADLPARGRLQPDEHAGDGGLARAGLADDRQRTAGSYGECRRRRRRHAPRTAWSVLRRARSAGPSQPWRSFPSRSGAESSRSPARMQRTRPSRSASSSGR